MSSTVGDGGGALSGPTAPAQGWQAPSAVERGLYEAKARGDWPAYYDLVARADLYMMQSRAYVDANPENTRFHPYWNPQTGTMCLAVYTGGMLPPPVADPVYNSYYLGWFAKTWEQNDPPYLVVNPGSPCEGILPAGPEGRALWQHHAASVEEPGLARDAVHTLETGGPRSGAVAFGLAVGAHINVRNGQYWNAMAYHGSGYRIEKNTLERWWSVTTREQWQRMQELLLSAGMVSDVWEFVLQLRRTMALDFAGPVDVEHWREAAAKVVRRRIEAATEPRLTPDGVTQGHTVTPVELDGQVSGVQRLIGRIARYEARFRADGLLPESGFVRSVEAWDYGRASGMARWGLAARLCSLQEAEAAVVRAGRLVQLNYRSWEAFSAAYILGRCLHFDEEEFGEWYETALATHRALTTDPTSPWLTLPWA
ncbi:uncharacterized protein DUF1266 [Streptomyces sp. KhCrAH-43]|uniref:DUF1266 domain-containing protein n=1 Tax=unclassified Streptomyces TaxID=2593676 RepID=UPI000DC3628F|nr:MULTISPECIES: DUF1266 domain-containing protein [unclassified Streptomyces]RAJ55912.1 uncharacterized protein DUF1266 [Streptomyces sp. KhCrAH-43]